MKRPQWLLLLVLLGVLAAGGQLWWKNQTEPWQRSVGLAVDLQEVNASWWPELQAAGVRFALVDEPGQVLRLPRGVQPVAVVAPETWSAWQSSLVQPAAVLFVDNRYPVQQPLEAAWLQHIPVGLVELMPVGDFATQPAAWGGRLLRVYDRPAHPFISEFTIAVRERQVNLVVVRLAPGADPVLGLEHVRQVGQALQAEGHQLTDSLQPRAALQASSAVFYLQALALGAVVAWSWSWLWPAGPDWLSALLPLLAVMGAGVANRFLDPWLTRQLLALAAAVVYPCSGLLWWWRQPVQQRQGSPTRQAWRDFGVITLFAGSGGLAVHALLSDFVFQMKILQFMGVKLAYALGIGWAILLVVVQWWRYGWGESLVQRRRQQWILAVVGLLVLLAAVYILLNRAGNQSLVPIMRWELTFRQWLEDVFRVRPRTKEFWLSDFAGGAVFMAARPAAAEVWLSGWVS